MELEVRVEGCRALYRALSMRIGFWVLYIAYKEPSKTVSVWVCMIYLLPKRPTFLGFLIMISHR